jgi:phosphate transport system protein
MADSKFPNRKGFESSVQAHYNEPAIEGDTMIRHIDSELQGLKDLALQMGGCVEKALENACKTLTSKDQQKAVEEVRKHEARINDLQILIDESCVNVLAKQGDQSKNIAYASGDLYKAWPQAVMPPQITQMTGEVRGMVSSVLDAFSRRDVELSQKVLKQDDLIDQLKDDLIREMKVKMKAGNDQIEIGLSFIMIAKNLERLADHATNIAEEVIYLATGNDVRHGHSVTANT